MHSTLVLAMSLYLAAPPAPTAAPTSGPTRPAKPALADANANARAQLQLSGGPSARQSLVDAGALRVQVAGIAPMQLRGSGAYYFNSTFGAALDGFIEWFVADGLNFDGTPTRVSTGSGRVDGALAIRYPIMSGLMLEGRVGYGYLSVGAIDGSTGRLVGTQVAGHGPVAALRLRLELGGWGEFQLHGRAAPISLGAATGTTQVAMASYGGGAQLAVGTFALAGFTVSPMAEYEVFTATANATGYALSQMSHRVSVGLKAVLPGEVIAPRIPTGPGRLRGRVMAGALPAAGAEVEVGKRVLTADKDGRFTVAEVTAGTVEIRAVMPGYKKAKTSVAVLAEEEATVDLALVKPSGPGSIHGLLRVVDPAGPAADIPVVVAGGEPVKTGPDGSFVIEKAGPGPVAITVKAKGYQPLEEIIQVAPEEDASVALSLRREGKKEAATLRGLIRSTAGEGLPATVRIKEAKVEVKADRNGRFVVSVPGGKYTVVIESYGFVTQTRSVEVGDGDQALFHCDLQRAKK